MIKLRNLSKTYVSADLDVTALENINLDIPKGKIHGIIGLSGAGKSTLVRCINRLEEPTSGQILIDNIDILSLKGKDLRSLRKKIGLIFQNFNLLNNKTIYENIAFPLRLDKVDENKIKAKVSYLLDLVDLKEKANVYPSQLSGGQKQRVGIARALANKPYILLCDEATSALDPKTTKQILNLLKKINKELSLTVVVITHEMEVIKDICDSVTVLEYGKIIDNDEVINVFSNPTATSTKELVHQVYNLPDALKHRNILALKFDQKTSLNPVVYDLIKDTNVKINILCGNIEFIQNSPIGQLLIEVENHTSIPKVIEYLKNKNVIVEVIEHE